MALAKEYGMGFFETSARTGTNVNEAFYQIGKSIKDNLVKNSNNGPRANGQKENGGTIPGGIGGKKKSTKQKSDCCK